MGLYTAARTARIVYRTHTPVTYWDQWTVVEDMMQSGGTLTLQQLWAQHGDHRHPFVKLACFADLRFFGGRNTSVLIEIYLIQICDALLFLWMFRRFVTVRGPAFSTAASCFVFSRFRLSR